MLIHHGYFSHVSGPTRSHQAQNRLNFVMEQSRGTTVTCFTKVLDLTRLSRDRGLLSDVPLFSRKTLIFLGPGGTRGRVGQL